MQDRQTDDSATRSARRSAKFSIILVACCAAVAILGIFIGVIVIYGGSQQL